MSYKKILTDEQLEYFVNHLSEISSLSDGRDFSDTDSILDPEYVPEEVNDEVDKENCDYEENDTNHGEEETAQNMKKQAKKDKEKLIWKRKNLILNDLQTAFHGNESLTAELLELSTPFECFKYFFNDKLLEKIVFESNLYAQQNNINKSMALSENELQQYIGILIFMSIVRVPNTRNYWNADVGLDPVKNIMTLNRFEKIRQFLHFNDNSSYIPRGDENHDRLHKLRPIIDHLNEIFSKVPLESCLSVDEQLCSTKIRHYMKQYLPMKPHKWGFKFFVLCGVSGFAYRFEVYSGQENNISNRTASEPDLGACANVVVRLARIIPKNMNYRLYFDNYYTTLDLLQFLAENGILALGTVRRNRITNCKLPTEKEMKKEARGTSYEYVTNYKFCCLERQSFGYSVVHIWWQTTNK